MVQSAGPSRIRLTEVFPYRRTCRLHVAGTVLPVLGQIGAIAAFDGGWLKQDSVDRYASGTLWGAALGLTSSGRWFSSQFTVGTPVNYPDWLAPDHLNVYYRVAVAF